MWPEVLTPPEAQRRQLLAAGVAAPFAAALLAAITPVLEAAQAGSSLQGAPVLSTLDGTPIHLDRYLGRALLLNLWATWCAPCVAEMPSLQALRAAHGPGGSGKLEVIAVNAGQSVNQVEGFLHELRLRLPIVMDPQKLTFARWRVRVLPTTLLFDADGTLRATFVGERDWTSPRALFEIDAALRPLPANRASA